MHEFLLLQPVCFLFLCLSFPGTTSEAQPAPPPLSGFKCVAENATCQALVGYVSTHTTTLAHIQSLFQVKTLSSLLGANILPPSTPQNYTIFPNQTVRIPFPCHCINDTGVSDRVPIYTVVKEDNFSGIANNVFSGQHFLGLVTYQQIQAANHIADANVLMVGQKLWIPLPCSCDDVQGQKVVHFGYVVAAGRTLDQIAADFDTTTETLADVNDIADPSKLQAGQVIDVPLKGQVLNHLANPSQGTPSLPISLFPITERVHNKARYIRQIVLHSLNSAAEIEEPSPTAFLSILSGPLALQFDNQILSQSSYL